MTQALPSNAANAPKQNRQQRRLQKRQARRGAKLKGNQGLLHEAGQHHVAGRLAEAEALYRRALQANRDEPIAHARLGALCAQSRRHAEALQHLEQAVALNPSDAPSQLNLGIVLDALGQTERADTAMREALRAAPGDAETQKNYGAWCKKLGRMEEAATNLELGLMAAPMDQPRQNLLGQVYAALGRSDDAQRRFQKGLELFPDDAELHANLGLILAHMSRNTEALPHLARGFPHALKSPEYQALFVEVLSYADPETFGPELEPALLTCLEDSLVDPQRISAAIGTRLWLKYVHGGRTERGEDGGVTKLHMEGILADPLLLKLLRTTVCIHLGLEALLVPLRRTLLLQARKQPALSEGAMLFMANFAMQCHANSYVFPYGEDEQQEVAALADSLERRIAEGGRPDPAFETQIALFAMYHPIPRLTGFEALIAIPVAAWSEPMRPLIERALHNPAQEEALKATIPSFSEIADEVSQAVRSQYEENPYPRWVTLQSVEHYKLADYIRFAGPWIEVDEGYDKDLTCLIAGCGTGKHPISAAMALSHAKVTAIDLSLSSLAYAKRMSEHYGMTNVEFLHGDILDVGNLQRDFPVIESSGVLHHMEHPEKGLEALLRILRPGGYLRLGLYSQIARRWITDARQRIQEMGLSPTPEAIRGFRQRIIHGQEPGVEKMVKMSDFFDLDSFRDLVFHVQEHQFTVPQLKDMLDRQGLRFLGFYDLSRPRYQAFVERFPDPASLLDLDCWAAFEEDHPDTFVAMYKFWCRKPL